MKYTYADFETTTSSYSTTESRVWLWGYKGGKKNFKRWGIDIDSWFKSIYEDKVDQMFFHNLSFDGNFIFKWLLKNGYLYQDVQAEELSENRWCWLCDERGTIYEMSINIKGHLIVLQCSYMLLMSSVGDLGDSLGFEKHSIDYNVQPYKNKNDVPKEYLRYLWRDIEIIEKSIEKVKEAYDLTMTRAGVSLKNFKSFYGQKQFIDDFGGKKWDYKRNKMICLNLLNIREWEFIKRSYVGGYVSWRNGIEGKALENLDGHYYDVNSLFPSVMLNYKMPYGKPTYRRESAGQLEVVEIFITWARPKHPNVINVFKKVGNIFTNTIYENTTENVYKYYWREELDFILEHYDIEYEEIKSLFFNSKMVFNGWIESVMNYKINAKDNVVRNFHKGVQNSLYGKFAQHYRKLRRIIIATKELERKPVQIYGRNGEWTHTNMVDESESRSFIPIGSYIPMKSRVYLLRWVMRNYDKWLYSDTDSIITTAPIDVPEDDDKYGYFKQEYKFTKFKVVRAKGYILAGKVEKYKNGKWIKVKGEVKKISGVSKDGQKYINFDNFEKGLIIPKGKKQKANVDGGIIIIEKDFKL